MAKQLNINLAMTADTSKAKRELQALQKQLDQLMISANKKDTSLGLSQEIQKATQLAAQLKVQLESATSSTGNLDLTKFNQALQKSGLQLKDYRTALQSLGTDGTKAFASLTSAIMQAEVPLRHTNARLAEFATTLKNTARWQFSSSILHGFMGALQGAYGYAQDLNESLNNIRIVTGQSVDQMARFAETANRAAKELSTTTTAYTDAALIYYQQGLSDEEVRKRTDATIKMANVSRQSAEEVSSQMTAIWNNFADGAKNLEYYADVITALGAATASSSDEIAQGLEKFASVADTVGLSYEKATAALATVVAETRQSADVVGTAFRTMFARFQGLSLGETLEDSVDLNKYSKALAAVGVNVLEANGQLKDMDTILDELGNKWNNISNAQQVALAETVAGTRQYAQLMALMNNYDKILANQNLATNSGGTLQKQADIYADSWEAAQKRVRAAAQGIYQDLLDDKAFIKMLNWLEKTITFFDKLIENVGGLNGVLFNLGTILMTAFGPQIQASIQKMVDNIKMISPTGRQTAQNIRQQAIEEVSNMAKSSINGTMEGDAIATAYKGQAQLQQILIDKAGKLTEEEKKRAQILLDINNTLNEQTIKAGKEADEKQRELDILAKQQQYSAVRRGNTSGFTSDQIKSNVADAQSAINSTAKRIEIIRGVVSQFNGVLNTTKATFKVGDEETKKLLGTIKELASIKLKNLEQNGLKEGQSFHELQNIIQECTVDFEKLDQQELTNLNERIKGSTSEVSSFNDEIDELENSLNTELYDNLANAYGRTEENTKEVNAQVETYINKAQEAASSTQTFTDQQINLENNTENLSISLKQMGVSTQSIIGKVQTFSTTIMQVGSAINALKSIGEIWSDEDITTGEKILQTMMSIGMVIPVITTLLQTKTAETVIATATEKLHAGAMGASAVAAWALTHPIIVLTALLAALVAVIALVANAQKKRREAIEKDAKKSQEKVEATKKEIEENNKLIKTYEEALKAQNETTESKIKVRNAALEVADALDIENGALLVQQENYEALTKAIKASQIEKNKELRIQNDDALAKTKTLFSSDIGTSDFFGVAGQSFELKNSTPDFLKLLNQFDFKKAYFTPGGPSGGATVQLNVSSNDIEGQIEAYEDIEELTKKIAEYDKENNTSLTSSKAYKDMINWLSQAEESYNKINELKQQGIEIDLSDEILRRDTITTQQQYNELLEDSIKRIKEQWNLDETEARKAAEAYFSLNKELSDFVVKHNALEDLSKATGKTITELQKYIDKYGDVVYKVSPDLLKAEENLDEIFSILQKRADKEDIKIKIGLYRQAQKDWKVEMSADEIADFFSDEKYGNLFENENDQNAFLKLGFQDQQNYLFLKELNAINQTYSKQNINEQTEDINKLIAQYNLLIETEKNAPKGSIQAEVESQNKIEEYLAKIEEYKVERSHLNSEQFQLLGEVEKQNLIANQLSGIDNLDSLDTILGKLTTAGLDIPINQLADALTNVAEKYKNTVVEIQNYHDAVLNGDEASIAAAEDALRAATRIGEAAEKYGLSVDSLEIQAEQIKATNKEMNLSAEMAAKMAVANQRMNKGITTLNKDFATWRKTLESSESTSQDYADTAAKVTDAIRDLVNASDDFKLPADFLQSAENLQLLEEAAKGSEKAINLLGLKLAEAAIQASEFNEAVASTFEGSLFEIDEKGFEAAQQAVINGIQNIRNHLDQLMNGTITLDDVFNGSAENWINNLNKMAVATGMSVAQMNDLLNQLGVQADINIITAKEQMQVPTEDIYYENLPEKDLAVPMPVGIGTEGNEKNFQKGFGLETPSQIYRAVRKIVAPGPMYTVEGYRQIAQIGTTKNSKAPKVHFTGVGGGARAGGVSSSSTRGSGGSGGSSKRDTASKKNFRDELERYHWLNEELGDLTREYDNLSKAKDRAFGKNRIKLINQEIEALEKLGKHNQQYLKSIQSYHTSDLNNLMNGGINKTYTSNDESGMERNYIVQGLYSYGFGADSFDEHGNLLNYDEIVAAAVAKYNAAVDAYNVSAQDAAAKDMLQEAELQHESFMELIKIYEDTNNLYQDKLQEILDNFRQAQDARLEALQYELELKISFNDADLKRLEYERKMLKDDMFKAAEYLRTIWNGKSGPSNWINLQSRASTVLGHASDLLNATHGDIVIDEEGNIISNPDLSDEGWVDALRNAEDEIYNTIDSLWELDDTMCHYYEETLQEGERKLDQYMSKLEDCTKVLQHFQTISELLGKEEDYEWMGEILASQRDSIKNELESAQLQFKYAQEQYDAMMQRYNETKDMVDEGTRQKMEDELQAQYEAMVKWQDKMYEKTEEYTQASIALYENMVKQQSKILENAMTGGLGFDSMLDSMENISSTQDMILTKTNQIYETNKLMRQISQDLDKTNNLAAKNRLQSFSNEIANMQKMNTMSKFDLEVAKARYKLLLAQIALEDARNAKSTVRLQRDNEGNFGYVYTADADKINSAEQDIANAENDLYNLSLNKANENAQALIQLDKELHDELERIAIEYRGNDEKIQEEQARVREEYAKKRQQIEADYLTALFWLNETATTDISEAWSTRYQDMILSSEEWQIAVNDYVVAVNDIYEEWRRDMDENITPSIGENLDILKEKIGDVLDQSEEYEDWFNDFAAQNADRLNEISLITNEYYKQRDAILNLIQSLMDYCGQIDEAIAKAAEFEAAQYQAQQIQVPAQTATPTATNPGYTTTGGSDGSGTGGYGGGSQSQSQSELESWWVRKTPIGGGKAEIYGKPPEKANDPNYSYMTEEAARSMYNSELKFLGSKWLKLVLGHGTTTVSKTEYDQYNDAVKSTTGFATGGYTGDWSNINGNSSNGKLAFLHQKELVLNQDDTENFLSAIKLVRSISQAIDLRAAASSFGAGINSPSLFNTSSGFEQQVTIHAEFPNAQDHNEIEEAFNNLINRATQFVGRPKI